MTNATMDIPAATRESQYTLAGLRYASQKFDDFASHTTDLGMGTGVFYKINKELLGEEDQKLIETESFPGNGKSGSYLTYETTIKINGREEKFNVFYIYKDNNLYVTVHPAEKNIDNVVKNLNLTEVTKKYYPFTGDGGTFINELASRLKDSKALYL
jgi:hypothetical protein